MIPAGVAAVQARMSVIQSRFAATEQAPPASSVDFDRMLATAQSERSGSTRIGGGLGVSSSAQLTTDRSNTGHVHTEHVHAGTGIGPAGAPPELAAYGNGKIPLTALEPIGQGSHRLWQPAAKSFRAMADAAARDGVVLPVSDSYRSYEAQVSVAERKGLYGQGGLAAVPGTSNHGWGRSLDIDTDGGSVEWLRSHAAEYGFHEDVPGEPWHWTYRPAGQAG